MEQYRWINPAVDYSSYLRWVESTELFASDVTDWVSARKSAVGAAVGFGFAAVVFEMTGSGLVGRLPLAVDVAVVEPAAEPVGVVAAVDRVSVD